MASEAARDEVTGQAARVLALANDTRLPREVRDEAEDVTACLLGAANKM